MGSLQNTILGQNNWTDGRLYGELFTNQTSYVGSNQSNDIYLSLYANNSAGLTFPVNDSSIVFTFYLANAIFSPNNFQIPVACVYPLSGQYDTLTRGLYYLLLMFSLLFRRHTWLSTAALGTAMTYAATTAVHSFALATNFGWGTPQEPSTFDSTSGLWLPNGWDPNSTKDFGDIDIHGVYPILSSAAILLTPILNWSVTIRKHNAQSVVVYWAVLIFAALVPAWLRYNFIGRDWWYNTPLSFALCPYSNDPAFHQCGPKMDLTFDLYNRCQCVDFCGAISTATPMRKNANMVPFLGREIFAALANSEPVQVLSKFNEFILAFIVVQGMFGLIESQFTQAEVRNYVFRAMYTEPRDFIILLFEGKPQQEMLKRFGMQEPSPKTSFRWRVQLQFARLIAATFFVSAILFAIVCPLVFISNIVTTESALTQFPVSELSDSVGAWSSWTGAAFVLIAAIINEYHKAWMKSLRVALLGVWRLIQHTNVESEKPTNQRGASSERVRDRVKAFFREISIPFIHAWYSTLRAFWTIRYTQHTFGEWFKDPIQLSKQTRKEAQEQADDFRARRSPKCKCQQCKRDRAKGLDEKKVLGERKGSTFGEHVAKGIEKRYSVKKAEQGEHEHRDFGLPTVPASSALSLPLVNIDISTTPEHPPLQPRQTFMRQNTEPPPRFKVPRKPVLDASRADSVSTSTQPEPTPGLEREDEALLRKQVGTDPKSRHEPHSTKGQPDGEESAEQSKRLSKSRYERLATSDD